jgi:hypothetical protein
MKTGRKSWKRRVQRLLNWVAYFACAGLVAVVLWLFTTRQPTPFSFSGTSNLLSCEQAPVLTVSEDLKEVEYPHIHVPADALIATGTALGISGDGEESPQARISVPMSPQATAFIKFRSRYTIRVFMHEGDVLSILPGDVVPVASTRPWRSLGMPSEYTVAFLFHYQPDSPLWRVVGTEDAEFSLRTSGFDIEQAFVKPAGKRLQIAGIPSVFKSAPVALGCCSSNWPPLEGLHVTLTPSGQTADYDPELFVHLRRDFSSELVGASPLMCRSGSIVAAVGEISLGTSSQLLKTPDNLHEFGRFEVRVAPEKDHIRYIVSGTATSITLRTHELVPTRLEAMGAFWAGLLSTVAAALVITLIATKGRAIQLWFRKS